MKIAYDSEYEHLETSFFRETDKNNYVMFQDMAGRNEEIPVIETHWHEWLEITYIIDGKMTLMTPQGEFRVESDQIAVIGMHTLHRITGNIGDYRYQCLHINLGFILQYFSPILLNDKVFIIKDRKKFLAVFQEIIHLIKHDDIVSQLNYKASILRLLSLCLKEAGINKDYDQNDVHDVFSRILFYVSTHYTENLSLKRLSDDFGYTTQYISSLFKKNLKINYLVYLNKMRLDKARMLLKSTHKHIIDIALECGFSNEHSLILNFKKVYGLTPTQYRRSNYSLKKR